MVILPKVIFLFGHRKNMGKDTCCKIMQNLLRQKSISSYHTYFAKLLKQQIAIKYNLDFSKMDNQVYKDSEVPWVSQKETVTESSFLGFFKKRHSTFKNKTVRDILIEEGCNSRATWKDVWANATYQDIFTVDMDVALVSDFRFPNEYDSFETSLNYLKSSRTNVIGETKVVKVLVHKSDEKLEKDGADDQLPDIDPYWDHIIMNDAKVNWQKNLEDQCEVIIKKYLGR